MPPRARQSALQGTRRGERSLDDLSGAGGYITPNWYATKAETGKVVPTWNYAVVHAYGRPDVKDDVVWLRRHVGELTAQQEKAEARPWQVSDAPERYIEVMLRGIVGFRFVITRLEGKWKMSQNREMPDRAGVVEGLVSATQAMMPTSPLTSRANSRRKNNCKAPLRLRETQFARSETG